MRWEEVVNHVPQEAVQRLARVHPSVEAFLVSRSNALGATSVPHGSHQAPQATATNLDVGLDPDTLSRVEAAVAELLVLEWQSGLQLMHELRSTIQVLPTGCAAIDALLGGGLREGTVVEIAGETAGGKTQLCLSAAATTAFRNEPVLYFDTTGSFAPERIAQLAEAEAVGAAMDGSWPQAPDPNLASRVLGCISVARPATVYDLLTSLDRLEVALRGQQPQAAQPGGPVGGAPAGLAAAGAAGSGPGSDSRDARGGPRLLVVDSVSALLSTVLGNNQHTQGSALLSAVGCTLKQLAQRHSIAVLVTNHVTSAAPLARGGGSSRAGQDSGAKPVSSGVARGVGGLKPALGELWRSQPHMRVQLSLDDSQPQGSGSRIATLTASPLQACGQKATFRITENGLG